MKRYILFLLAAIILIILTGCPNNEDLFPEYRGLNLIQNISLSKWVPDQNTTYMNYESVSGSGYEPPSGHDGAEVYRLEIKNLIPNGDFEGSTVGSAPNGWSIYNGGGPNTLEIIDTTSYIINNKTMHYKLGTADDRIDFDLRDETYGATDGLVEGASYLVRFSYRSPGPVIFELNDTAVSIYNTQVYGGIDGGKENPDLNNLLEFPPPLLKEGYPDITIGSASDYNYCFGSIDSRNSGPQEAYIDNFRLTRTDLYYKLRLSLSFASDTPEPLLSGYYRFSIYVKRDPSAGTNNRFQTDRVCIGIKGGGVASDGETFDESSFSKYQIYYDGEDNQDWSSWSQINVDLFLQIPISSDDTKVMELTICPTDDSLGSLKKDIGSILISSPSLEMYPDGFPSE